jgi:hypothetical protein
MSASSSVQLPEDILTAARNQAEQLGIPVEDWVTVAVAEHLNGVEAAQEFFRTGLPEHAKARCVKHLMQFRITQLISATNSTGW